MGIPPEETEAYLRPLKGQSPTYWTGCVLSEMPQRRVVLSRPLYLGMHEVTQAAYEQVMKENPSHFSSAGAGKDLVTGLETSQLPVETVSWLVATDFCNVLSQSEGFGDLYSRKGEEVTILPGNGYGMPTEPQWEYACRAGTTTRYWSGDQHEDLLRAGWYGKNAKERTQEVGTLAANAFGLFDVHGNLSEWVEDDWNRPWYTHAADQPAFDPDTAGLQVLSTTMRGGYYGNGDDSCRSATRSHSGPATAGWSIGIRLMLPVDAVKQALLKRANAGTDTKARPADSPVPVDLTLRLTCWRWSTCPPRS